MVPIWPHTIPEVFEEEPPDPPQLEVEVSENPIVAELLDVNGEVIRRWLARPPVGFAVPHVSSPD